MDPRLPSIQGEAFCNALPVIEDPQPVPGMAEHLRQHADVLFSGSLEDMMRRPRPPAPRRTRKRTRKPR